MKKNIFILAYAVVSIEEEVSLGLRLPDTAFAPK